MEKIVKTNQLSWRTGEVSVKQFQLLAKEEKLLHIDFLLKLKPEELSTNDIVILNFYGPSSKQNNFFTLNED